MLPVARLAAVLSLTSSLAVLACSHSSDEADKAPEAKTEQPAPEPATPEPNPEPEDAAEPKPAPAAAKVEQLSFVASELGDKDGELEHCLDCKRKAARYSYCRFAKDALAAAIGEDNMAKPVTVEVEMVERSSETVTPDDPNAPQPEGGFTHTYFSCTVTKLVGAE